MQRTPKRPHSSDSEALVLTLLLFGPGVLCLFVTMRLTSLLSPEVEKIAAGAAFGTAMVILLLIDWVRPRFAYFLTGGIALALTMSAGYIAYRFQLWWALVAGLVVYVVILGVGARHTERRRAERTDAHP